MHHPRVKGRHSFIKIYSIFRAKHLTWLLILILSTWLYSPQVIDWNMVTMKQVKLTCSIKSYHSRIGMKHRCPNNSARCLGVTRKSESVKTHSPSLKTRSPRTLSAWSARFSHKARLASQLSSKAVWCSLSSASSHRLQKASLGISITSVHSQKISNSRRLRRRISRLMRHTLLCFMAHRHRFQSAVSS